MVWCKNFIHSIRGSCRLNAQVPHRRLTLCGKSFFFVFCLSIIIIIAVGAQRNLDSQPRRKRQDAPVELRQGNLYLPAFLSTNTSRFEKRKIISDYLIETRKCKSFPVNRFLKAAKLRRFWVNLKSEKRERPARRAFLRAQQAPITCCLAVSVAQSCHL